MLRLGPQLRHWQLRGMQSQAAGGTPEFGKMPGRLLSLGLRGQQSPPQSEPVESEVKGRETSYMQSQQSAKNLRAFAKDLKGTLLNPRTAVKREHQSRHQQGAQCQAPV